MANIEQPHFDEPREQPGFACRRARLSRQAGSERLGLSLWELPPGEAAYPFHYHLTEEELLVVSTVCSSCARPMAGGSFSGVRWSRSCGERRGAHQIGQPGRGDGPLSLPFSTSGEPDVVMYPDSGKLGAFERLPDGGGLRAMFRISDTVDYHDGERPPR